MTSTLLTRDADALRTLWRPRWQRRGLAWVIPVATSVVIGLTSGATPAPGCTPADPCAPDPASALGLGLAVAIAVTGVIDSVVAGWLAVIFTVSGIAYDLTHPASAGPEWLYAADLALVACCFAVARLGRVRQPHGYAIPWLAAVRYKRPPAPGALPGLGRAWRIAAVGLILPALGFAGWAWSVQTRMDARQQAATQVPAEVVRLVDDTTVRVRTSDDRNLDLAVRDARGYHTGQQLELFVDSGGLRQPVTEPYDASGWLILSVLLAGTGIACVHRGRQARAGLVRLFNEPQPATQAYVRMAWGQVAVYAGDARPGEPAVAVIPVFAAPHPAPETATQPATLYGIPAPGHWCTVVVDGTPMVPLRQVPATVNAPAFTDPLVRFPIEEVPAPPVPRPGQIEALSPEDRDGDPYRVRTYTPPALVGSVVMAAPPLVLIPVVKLLPGLSFAVALGLAGVLLALTCWIGWRIFVRPRAAWNGAGIAIVGILGAARLTWPEVVAIEVESGVVLVKTAEAGWALPALALPGPLRATHRTAEQLAATLRLARERGTATPPALDPPYLAQPAAPLWSYLVWLGWSPVLAWLFQLFSRH